MTSPIIAVEDLSKAFSVYRRPSDIVYELVTRRKRHDDFWALKNISFVLNEKQRLGVIGPNGSGKSTLLKILTGHLPATSGKVRVEGRVSAMLSLNTVLNPEETGLSNIKFNLLLNGAPKKEMDALVEEIIEFTELGPFIYSPVRTYSSGMNAKLAFAINTAIKPEILVIDEVLSVGDAYFVGKATKRMLDLCDQGKALVFVSHSNSAVQMLCDTVLWLDNGEIRMLGPVDQVIKAYEEDFRRCEDLQTREGNVRRHRARGSFAVPGEMGLESRYLVRICSTSETRGLEDTHFVRRISIEGAGVPEAPVGLSYEVGVAEEKGSPRLDLLGSEWGRLFNKGGSDCRILSARTGRRRGGQIRIPADCVARLNGGQLTLRFETASIRGKEALGVEFLDYSSGQWKGAEDVARRELGDGWIETEARVLLTVVDEEDYQKTVLLIERNNRPDVEIAGVQLVAEGTERKGVRERNPFSICVEVVRNRKVKPIDVGIKVIRSDGVYFFWQSSGLVGVELESDAESSSVEFRFEDNCFPAGSYEVSAYIANGWDFPANYPYSEVYDRKVGVLTFSVYKEFPELDFGAINKRIPVVCEVREMV